MATTTPGGRYIVAGRLVNAEGEPIVEAEIVAQPEATEPEAPQVEDAPEQPEATEPEAVVASPKRKRKS